MTRDKTPSSIETVYGRVDGKTLEQLQEEFDTYKLLDLIDEIDALRDRICDPDGMRAELLKLHAMAHTVINDAPLTMGTDDLTIWELADELATEFATFANQARRASSLLDRLAKLMPEDGWDEKI